jgi:hypothetical protein
MKVMAIGTLKPLSPEERQKYLPDESRRPCSFISTARWSNFGCGINRQA